MRRVLKCALLCIAVASIDAHATDAASSITVDADRVVTRWAARIEALRSDAQLTDDWLDVPLPGPGVAAAMSNLLTTSKSPIIRERAARSLGELRLDPAVSAPALIGALLDTSPDVRVQAIDALQCFGHAAQPYLWNAAADFRPVASTSTRPASSPPTVISDYIACALRGLPGLDAGPFFAEYRRALQEGRWRNTSRPDSALAPSAGFAGSTEHLRAILEVVFSQVDADASQSIGVYLNDPNPEIRSLALHALRQTSNPSGALTDIRHRWPNADSTEKRWLMALLARSGAEGFADLCGVLDSDVTAPDENLAVEVITGLMAAPADRLVGELSRAHAARLQTLLLAAALSRAEAGTLPVRSNPPVVAGFREQLARPETREAAVNVLLQGIISAADNASDQGPLSSNEVLQLPRPLASGIAQVLIAAYPRFEKDTRETAITALGRLAPAADSDSVVNFLRGVAMGNTGPDHEADALREAAVKQLLLLGAAPPIVVEWVQAHPDLEGLQFPPAVDPKSEAGAAVLTEIVRRAPEEPDQSVRLYAQAFWRLVDANPDPAACARTLAQQTKSKHLRQNARALLAAIGNATERLERRNLGEDAVQAAIIYGDDRLAGIIADVGSPDAREWLLAKLMVEPAQVIPAIRYAMEHREDRFPWEKELAARAVSANDAIFTIIHDQLRQTKAGRDALAAASARLLEGNYPRWLALLREDSGTDKELRDAVAALQAASGYEPRLKPLWLALGVRARERTRFNSGVQELSQRLEPLAAAWRTAHPAPMVAASVAAVVPTTAPETFLADLKRNLLAQTNDDARARVIEAAIVSRPALSAQVLALMQSVLTADSVNAIARQLSSSSSVAAAMAANAQPTATSTPPATASAAGPDADAQFQQYQFPWPPPPPVVWATFKNDRDPLNRRWLGNDETTLEEVNDRLQRALEKVSTKFSSGLFPVPGGFALVTRIERIRPDGDPFPGEARWAEGSAVRANWPEWMFYEKPGYFRKIVFAITTDANIRSEIGHEVPDPEKGGKNLPPGLAQLTLRGRYVHVLVYAFEKLPGGKWVEFTSLTAEDHIQHSGLPQYLSSHP